MPPSALLTAEALFSSSLLELGRPSAGQPRRAASAPTHTRSPPNERGRLGRDVRARGRSIADINEIKLESAGASDSLTGREDGPHIVKDGMAAVRLDG